MSRRLLESLEPGDYRVVIDATLEERSLTSGELRIPGSIETEFLLSAHVCHPALVNDNLSGPGAGRRRRAAVLLAGLRPARRGAHANERRMVSSPSTTPPPTAWSSSHPRHSERPFEPRSRSSTPPRRTSRTATSHRSASRNSGGATSIRPFPTARLRRRPCSGCSASRTPPTTCWQSRSSRGSRTRRSGQQPRSSSSTDCSCASKAAADDRGAAGPGAASAPYAKISLNSCSCRSSRPAGSGKWYEYGSTTISLGAPIAL